jgi:hypothetical protein
MEENLDKLFDYRALIPGSGRFASIVGIGGSRSCGRPDAEMLSA